MLTLKYLSTKLEKASPLPYPDNRPLAARTGFGVGAVVVAEDADAYAAVVAGESPLFEEGLAFFGFEHFLRAVDPAGVNAYRVGRVKEIAHD